MTLYNTYERVCMKIHQFFLVALLSVAGVSSLQAAPLTLEQRVEALEKKVAALEKNTLFVSQGKLFAELQEEATSLQQKMMADVQKKQAEIESKMKALEEKKKDSKDPKAVDAEMAKLQQQFGQEFQKIQAEGKKQDEALKGKADKIMADFVKEANARGYTNVQLLETCLPTKTVHPHESIVDDILGSLKKAGKAVEKEAQKIKSKL